MLRTKAKPIANEEIDQRVEKLLVQMTLKEKVGQLNQEGFAIYTSNDSLLDDTAEKVRQGLVGSFLAVSGVEKLNAAQRIAVEESRLGIPLIFGHDVIHGQRTITPIPLGEAASWDLDAIESAAAIAAREARANGIHWTFAPMVDIARDPRWGRIAEGAGEDTYLGCQIASARVRGFQGDDPSQPDRVAACAKHFVAYGAAVGGRDYNSVDMSERQLREVYLPPFAAALDEGCLTVMCAFNDLNGVPCSGNAMLLNHLLRDELGFEGFVVSDAYSIREMINHGHCQDLADAGEKGILAGVDMDMGSHAYLEHLEELVESGSVLIEVVDEAVRRILRIKFLMGLFEEPYADPEREQQVILAPENRNAARDVARKSMVLLKNEKQVLPFQQDPSRIALIGPLAEDGRVALGCWSFQAKADDVVTILPALKERFPNAEIRYEQGSALRESIDGGIEKAIGVAKWADIVILAIGEDSKWSGEAHCVTDISLPSAQQALVDAVVEANDQTAVVLLTGRSMAIPELVKSSPALLCAWHPGTEFGPAVCDVLFGVYNPSGKLPVTFPYASGQVPLYYNHFKTGRPGRADGYHTSKYLDAPIDPLFPFGYGLSYTTFEYDKLTLSAESIIEDEKLKVSIDISNSGALPGHEIVQLYLTDCVASVVRPVRELRAFQKIHLQPGESKIVEFELGFDDFSMFNSQNEVVVESGEFIVQVGPNSRIGQIAHFHVTPK